MRIHYLACYQLPSRAAHSVHIMKMCGAFAELGHKVELVYAGSRGAWSDSEENLFFDYGVDQQFRMHALQCGIAKGAEWAWAWRALKYIGQSDSDLIYTRSLPAAVLAVRSGRPVVLELHRLPSNMLRPAYAGVNSHEHPPVLNLFKAIFSAASKKEESWLLPGQNRLSISEYLEMWRMGAFTSSRAALFKAIQESHLRRVVVISRALKQDLLSLVPIDHPRVLVAPDGADVPLDREMERPFPKSPSAALTVGYAGHLYRGKGMELIAELAPLCPWASFHIVGGTDQDIARWREATSDLKNVHFHGYVSASDVPAFIRCFDVCVLPNQPQVATHGATEGKAEIGKYTSPLKMFEYMAAQKPIIASDLPVLREVLEHNRNAMLCRHDRPPEWAAALAALAEDEELRRRLATNAARDLREKYTWRKRAAHVLKEIYR